MKKVWIGLCALLALGWLGFAILDGGQAIAPIDTPAGTTELILGLFMAVCFAAAIFRPHTLIGAPFLLLFAVGYLGIGLPRLRQSWERRAT